MFRQLGPLSKLHRLTIGLGLTPLNLLKKYTSAMWHVPKADGQDFPLLEPRTLPNGVSNVGWTQNVSVDVVLQESDVTSVSNLSTVTRAIIKQTILANIINPNTTDNFATKMKFGNYIPLNNTPIDTVESLNKYYFNSTSSFAVILPFGTTLAQARTLLAGTVIRYQLATPVDTLNIPFTNPVVDLKGLAPLTLQNFAGTSASGIVPVLCPNGKTVPFAQFDGLNDYGIANHPSLDITGTGTFYFGNVIRTSALVTQYFNIKAEQSEATTQYGLKLTNTGILSIILNGTDIQLVTGLLANTIYNVWVQRDGGLLKCFINTAETSSVANVTSLTTRPNFRWGALSTNVGGTTHTGFSNVALGTSVAGVTDATKARQAWFNFTLKTFGL